MAAGKVLYTVKPGRWITPSPWGKKGRVWKGFLFGNRSKPRSAFNKIPMIPSVTHKRAGRRKRVSDFRNAVHSAVKCAVNGSSGSMGDASMTGGAALDKRFFHSSSSPVAATAGATPVVTCQRTSDAVAQKSDVHRLSPGDTLCPRNQCRDIFGES